MLRRLRRPPHTFTRWLERLVRTKSTLSLEVFLALQMLGTGVYILWPGAPLFGGMAIVPDVALGGIMTTHGVGALLALYHLDVAMCRRSALVSVALWCFVLTLLFIAPPSDLIVIPLVMGLAFASGWVHVRLTLWAPRSESRSRDPWAV